MLAKRTSNKKEHFVFGMSEANKANTETNNRLKF